MYTWLSNIKKKYKNEKITKSDLKKLLFVIPISCLVTVIFYGVSELYTYNKQNQIKKNQCSTICTITEVKENRGKYVLLNFPINNKIISSRKHAPYDAFVGANYIINYQCNDPTNFIVLDNSIFFDNIGRLDTCVTYPKELEITEYFYRYSFIDKNGQVISRKQELNNSLTNKINNKSIKVLYLKEDSNKAILF